MDAAGHLTARRLVRDMLIEHLPGQLDARRTQLEVPFVPGLSEHAWYLTDVIPLDDVNPRILVSSSSSELVRSDGVAGTAPRLYSYDVVIAVTVFSMRELTEEQASMSRDVILLAVRDCTLLHRGLSATAAIVGPESGAEEIGPADVPDKLKRMVSVGQIAITVHQHEQALATIPAIDTATVSLAPLT